MYTQVVLALACLATSVFAAADTNFGASCSNIGLSGTILTATCENINGQPVNSALNIDFCVANVFGTLDCTPEYDNSSYQTPDSCSSSGNYAESCSGCFVSGTTLFCDCGDGNGGSDFASIDLSEYSQMFSLNY